VIIDVKVDKKYVGSAVYCFPFRVGCVFMGEYVGRVGIEGSCMNTS